MNKPSTSTSGARILRVLKLLRGHTLDGLSNKEISDGLRESPANISRALAVLVDEGLVTKLENGRYAHSVQMLQIAQTHAESVARTHAHLDEITQRIFAGSRG